MWLGFVLQLVVKAVDGRVEYCLPTLAPAILGAFHAFYCVRFLFLVVVGFHFTLASFYHHNILITSYRFFDMIGFCSNDDGQALALTSGTLLYQRCMYTRDLSDHISVIIWRDHFLSPQQCVVKVDMQTR